MLNNWLEEQNEFEAEFPADRALAKVYDINR